MNPRSLSRRGVLSQLLLLPLLGVATGCGSEDAPEEGFAEQPLTVVTSDAGKLRLAVWTSPGQPPDRGVLKLQLKVTDASSDAPVDGLYYDIVPDMPSMGHGTPTVPKTEAQGGGLYIVSDVNLFMAGRWQLRITITGSVSDVAIVQIDVR